MVQEWLINKGINVETIGGASDIELPTLVEHYVEYRGIDEIRKYVESRMNLTRVYNFKRIFMEDLYTRDNPAGYTESKSLMIFGDCFYIPEHKIIISKMDYERGREHYAYEDALKEIEKAEKLISGKEQPWWLASEVGIYEYEKGDIRNLIDAMKTARELKEKSVARINGMVEDAKDNPMRKPKEV